MSLTTDVMDRLAELGDTSDEVAETLIQQGAKGVREDDCNCPIYNYLAKHDIPVASVGDEEIVLIGGTKVKTTPVIAAFIYGFDQGDWPHLDVMEEVIS